MVNAPPPSRASLPSPRRLLDSWYNAPGMGRLAARMVEPDVVITGE